MKSNILDISLIRVNIGIKLINHSKAQLKKLLYQEVKHIKAYIEE